MNALFYLAGAVAVVSTVMTVTRTHAVHALLYFIVSLFSVAVVFFTLGAPFAAALEVIIYAGAIMVLFVFVVMLLNLGAEAAREERRLLPARIWPGPAALSALLLAGLALAAAGGGAGPRTPVGPREVGLALYGPYLIGVEIASVLLLAGLVGAYHIARRGPGRRSGGGR